MTDVGAATPEAPARRRESWSLKNLVEEIAGRPISELQDPDRPTHPYLLIKKTPAAPPRRPPGPSGSSSSAYAGADLELPTDPIDRVYPPLVGETGRALHGPDHEHHSATLEGIATAPEAMGPGRAPHAPGPSQRPERIYLHYLLLHMDRLNDHALRYLKHAVDEELRHREPENPSSETPPGLRAT